MLPKLAGILAQSNKVARVSSFHDPPVEIFFWSIMVPLVHLGQFQFTMVHFSLLESNFVMLWEEKFM